MWFLINQKTRKIGEFRYLEEIEIAIVQSIKVKND